VNSRPGSRDKPSDTHDIAIAGGGMIGAALARALAGTRVALVSREPRPAPAADAGFDARVYALSPGNAAFLTRLGAWSAIPARRLTPVRAMRIYGDDGAACIEFDAYRSGVAELAWIVEDCWLQDALWRGLEGQDGLALLPSAAIAGLQVGERDARLRLQDGREVAAQLVVGADGARSLVRSGAGIANDAEDYGQVAVVANFACGRPHRNVAWQWFQGPAQGGAVLALLPLPGDCVSMVWSTRSAHASQLLALDAEALAREVGGAARHALGELQLVTPARGFPLQRLKAARLVAPRIALAGDAAHVIHPLAGQGANLGLQDAQVLASVLAGREPGRDAGDVRLLRRYERRRSEAILAMRTTVHGLYRLFDAPGTAAGRLRNAGLNLADRLPVLKNLLMRHAME
jgi:ubiquinone biosynthesis UbiH/UbiF/VisC/COQ6 family hydroxylase